MAAGPTTRRWREAQRQRLHPCKLEPNIVGIFGLSFLTSRDCRRPPQDPRAPPACRQPSPPARLAWRLHPVPISAAQISTMSRPAACELDCLPHAARASGCFRPEDLGDDISGLWPGRFPADMKLSLYLLTSIHLVLSCGSFLLGEETYSDMRAAKIIGGIVNDSLCPQIPLWCDPEWEALMQSCWASDPAGRPSFTDISQRLRKMAAAMNVK